LTLSVVKFTNDVEKTVELMGTGYTEFVTRGTFTGEDNCGYKRDTLVTIVFVELDGLRVLKTEVSSTVLPTVEILLLISSKVVFTISSTTLTTFKYLGVTVVLVLVLYCITVVPTVPMVGTEGEERYLSYFFRTNAMTSADFPSDTICASTLSTLAP
jgi:hypothetical protein